MFVLDDLWVGNIHPNENINPFRSQYKKAIENLTKCEDKLLEVLAGEEQRSLLIEMEDSQMELSHWAELAAFVEGFRLGGKIILDMLDVKQ